MAELASSYIRSGLAPNFPIPSILVTPDYSSGGEDSVSDVEDWSVRGRIIDNLSEHRDRKNGFSQYQTRKSIISQNQIRAELSSWGFSESECKDLVAKIRPNDDKAPSFIFAFTLLVMACFTEKSLIQDIIKSEITDEKFPLEFIRKNNKDVFALCSGAKKKPLSSFRRLNPHNIEHFNNYQWNLTAVFFAPEGTELNPKFYPLSDSHVLPWSPTTCSTREPSMGGYGEVTVVHIKAEHHGFHGLLEKVSSSLEPCFM